MPKLKVPLIHPSHQVSITISYRIHGKGEHAVILLPGLLVPSSMYDIIAAILSSNPSFTVITLDNRGIGRSTAPPALTYQTGYTARNLALDAWAVVDHIIDERGISRNIGIVGHSMGGMIAQQMLLLYPKRVRFVGLLSTHAGGLRNLWPSIGILLAGCRLLKSGFDESVHADVNLRLHYTEKFLEEVVGGSLNISGEREEEEDEELDDEHVFTTPPSSPRNASLSSPNLTTPVDTPVEESLQNGLVRTSSGTDLRWLKSRLHYFTQEARLHFNLSPKQLTTTLRRQHQYLIRRLRTLTTTTRRELYHAQYTTSNGGSVIDSAIGHTRVVWSHTLPFSFAKKLRNCSKLVKLVVLGRHDQVVTPEASRRLARLIDATTVVEVDAAHFITDEVAAEVTTQILFGLRNAFFGGRRCSCEWCVEKDSNINNDCRLC